MNNFNPAIMRLWIEENEERGVGEILEGAYVLECLPEQMQIIAHDYILNNMNAMGPRFS